MAESLSVRSMEPGDEAAWSSLLTSEEAAYRKNFHPFTDESVEALIPLVQPDCRDQFWGIWKGSELIGFFMLRGWEEGYSRPSFGVMIAEKYSGKGLGRLALQTALCWCRFSGVNEVMLKVADSNPGARLLYESFGFHERERCSVTGHVMMTVLLGANIDS